MSMDYPRPTPTPSVTEREDVLFAARPVWERNRKRRPSAPRKAVPPTTRSAEVATTYRKVEHRSSAAPVALAAGAVGLVALGAVGWVMMRDASVPQMAPAGVETLEVAAAPITPLQPPMTGTPPMMETPSADPSPVESDPAPAVRRTEPAAAARTRPAPAAPSAGESSVDASASEALLPNGPQPYSTLNPEAASAPPPTEAAPPVVPDTPPIQAEPIPEPVNPINPAAPPETTPPL